MDTMTRYQRAKYIVSMATVLRSGIGLYECITNYPWLSDKECKKLAKESICSYRDVRDAFLTEDEHKEQITKE